MNLRCQQSALEELRNLSNRDRHSILIEGVSGCGKTYLSKQYARMLNISDLVNVSATVGEIRKAIDMSYNLESRVVICIENLDSGVAGASYTLLKFLEEPRENIYIVVTCSNINKVPDTIVSRSSVVTVAVPTESDLDEFIKSYPIERQKMIDERDDIRRSIKSFLDVDYCMSVSTTSYFDHLESLLELIQSKKPISDISWALGHYPDGSEIPIRFVMNYLVSNTSDKRIRKYGIECMRDLDSSRLASHAVLAKFVMDAKYSDG